MARTRVERRLAAVLAADVVGYARLMERDEDGTLERLKTHRTELVEPLIAEHGGRIVKLMGDGALCEFASVIDAVNCALLIQQGMAERDGHLSENERIRLRIGVNLGEVIHEADGDIYGDGVNIAARLERLAEPGGLVISGTAFDQLRGDLGSAFSSLGEQRLKNIERPVRAYRIATGGGDAQPPERPALPLPDRPSLAVLPFDNLSGDPEQGYFADGIVEDITTALSRMRWLFVIARNSSFTYKGRAVNVKQVGRELGVRYVLEGSVRKAGTKVRITGQLIDASTGAHLWADHFDGELASIFDLQDQVTANVVGAIAPKLEQVEIDRVKCKPTESLDAYDYYLRGLAAFHQFTQPGNKEALEHFTRAIELDPQYASAYGMAARCYLQRKGFGWVGDREREIAEAERLARRAADLGRDDAVAFCAAGFTLVVVVGDLDYGPALIDRALALNPNLGWAWHFSALTKAFLGEPEAALEHAARALRLSPHDPQIFAMHAATAVAHFISGRYDESLLWAQTALRVRPNFLVATCVAAASAALAGRVPEAESAMRRLRQLNPTLRLSNLNELLPFRRQIDFEKWSEGMEKAGLPK